MQIQVQQDTITIELPKNYKNIGIKMSGGTDSSIIAYMLAYYKKHFHSDLNLHAITMDHPQKAFQVEFAKKIIIWIRDNFGFDFVSHTTGVGSINGSYSDEQFELLEQSYKQNNLDCHFMGETTNPIDYKKHNILVKKWSERNIERDITMRGKLSGKEYITSQLEEWNVEKITYRGYYPLLHIDKRNVAELYKHFGLTDKLFPLTRSCEQETNDFSNHCGKCWWCAEREYGFGRLV